MRVIIAGSRMIHDMAILASAIEESGFEITTLITGCANGIDHLAYVWVERRMEIAFRCFRADWSQGRKAGPLRNEEMAKHADALIAVWDGKSKGTKDMIARARKHGLKVYVKEVKP